MMAGERRARRGATPVGSADQGNRHAPAEQNTTKAHVRRRKTTVASLEAEVAAHAAETARRATRVRVDAPAIAPCVELDHLPTLGPDQARRHVDAYLRDVMTTREADDFEAMAYRWELHLVELDQLKLVRTVDLNKRKLAHYRAVLRKSGAFPPLIGLGGDGRSVTDDVLLLDGYHRALAMRDVGLCFAWMWLAVGAWKPAQQVPALAGERRV